MGGSSAPLPAVEAAMVEEAGHILQLMQRATQYADAATMALTVAYCAMVAHDVAQPDASAARFSSRCASLDAPTIMPSPSTRLE